MPKYILITRKTGSLSEKGCDTNSETVFLTDEEWLELKGSLLLAHKKECDADETLFVPLGKGLLNVSEFLLIFDVDKQQQPNDNEDYFKAVFSGVNYRHFFSVGQMEQLRNSQKHPTELKAYSVNAKILWLRPEIWISDDAMVLNAFSSVVFHPADSVQNHEREKNTIYIYIKNMKK